MEHECVSRERLGNLHKAYISWWVLWRRMKQLPVVGDASAGGGGSGKRLVSKWIWGDLPETMTFEQWTKQIKEKKHLGRKTKLQDRQVPGVLEEQQGGHWGWRGAGQGRGVGAELLGSGWRAPSTLRPKDHYTDLSFDSGWAGNHRRALSRQRTESDLGSHRMLLLPHWE